MLNVDFQDGNEKNRFLMLYHITQKKRKHFQPRGCVMHNDRERVSHDSSGAKRKQTTSDYSIFRIQSQCYDLLIC